MGQRWLTIGFGWDIASGREYFLKINASVKVV